MLIDISGYKKIVILTGAGVSAASGLQTYRGKGGVWDEYNVEEYGHIDRLHSGPLKVWQLFGALREEVRGAEPNPAHFALAELEKSLLPDQELFLITQNVDGLHRKAGSEKVIELHGRIDRTRCSNEACELEPYVDTDAHLEKVPLCPKCESPLRPDIVLFGEVIPTEEGFQSKRALRGCDLYLSIGTSGLVSPASNFVRSAEFEGARTIYINLEPMEPHNPKFKEMCLGKAEEILPKLFGITD